MALVEKRGGNINLQLPGVRSGDMASRNTKPEVRVYSLQFSPTGWIYFLIYTEYYYDVILITNQYLHIGQAWVAATTEGLLLYSLDAGLVFDPFELELGITPEAVKKALSQMEYAKGLEFIYNLISLE